MSNFELRAEQAQATYNEEDRIVTITYQGRLGSDVTVQVYDWLDELYKAVGLDNIYGEIFDFREVTAFEESNLSTARRTSNRMNMSLDTSQFPVALIVADHEQEEILRGPMRIPEGHARKRIVRSEQDAVEFLHEWNSNKQKG